jgi:hypothetical protein
MNHTTSGAEDASARKTTLPLRNGGAETGAARVFCRKRQKLPLPDAPSAEMRTLSAANPDALPSNCA